MTLGEERDRNRETIPDIHCIALISPLSDLSSLDDPNVQHVFKGCIVCDVRRQAKVTYIISSHAPTL